jgi:hypothetical protein
MGGADKAFRRRLFAVIGICWVFNRSEDLTVAISCATTETDKAGFSLVSGYSISAGIPVPPFPDSIIGNTTPPNNSRS